MPFGERALDWAERYLLEVRPSFVRSSTEDALYLSEYGERLSDDGSSGRVSEYVKGAALGKLGVVPSLPAHDGGRDAGGVRTCG